MDRCAAAVAAAGRGPVPRRTRAERRGRGTVSRVAARGARARPPRAARALLPDMDALSDDDEYTRREPQVGSLLDNNKGVQVRVASRHDQLAQASSCVGAGATSRQVTWKVVWYHDLDRSSARANPAPRPARCRSRSLKRFDPLIDALPSSSSYCQNEPAVLSEPSYDNNNTFLKIPTILLLWAI